MKEGGERPVAMSEWGMSKPAGVKHGKGGEQADGQKKKDA